MPKLIDYPRTSYAGAWEVADVVDDTGGKCALDTCARKLNRKVSGSFKAIIGSAVKFGLLTSKRELLTTTTLFRRIKHAYDKQEELVFHREAFLTPPLFTQLCRKFRSRELPVQMLDIMLIREFDVEEINAQGVAKAFIDGARMVGLLDEHNIVADIDQLAAQQPPRRELASPELTANSFRAEVARANQAQTSTEPAVAPEPLFAPIPATPEPNANRNSAKPASTRKESSPPTDAPLRGHDAVASLFGLSGASSGGAAVTEDLHIDQGHAPTATATVRTASSSPTSAEPAQPTATVASAAPNHSGVAARAVKTAAPSEAPIEAAGTVHPPRGSALPSGSGFRIELSGPGLNTVLDIQDEDDVALARILLDKIARQLKTK